MTGLEQRRLAKPRGRPNSSRDAALAAKDSKKKWEKKVKERERTQRIRKLSKQLKDEIHAEQRRAAESRKANAERKKENERKNMVVQTIKNEKAIRKLSPKHRRTARIFMLHELN